MGGTYLVSSSGTDFSPLVVVKSCECENLNESIQPLNLNNKMMQLQIMAKTAFDSTAYSPSESLLFEIPPIERNCLVRLPFFYPSDTFPKISI